jgi:hypothetical protein
VTETRKIELLALLVEFQATVDVVANGGDFMAILGAKEVVLNSLYQGVDEDRARVAPADAWVDEDGLEAPVFAWQEFYPVDGVGGEE